MSFLKSVEESFCYQRMDLDDDRQIKLFKNGNTVVINGEDGKRRVYSDGVFFVITSYSIHYTKLYEISLTADG